MVGKYIDGGRAKLKMMFLDINPRTIDNLMQPDNRVFVFGSNLAGRHGKGAAKSALQWGAIYGKGVGFAGRTYAIPTKDERLSVLSIPNIRKEVDNFLAFANDHPDLDFLVTPIGCGLAGFLPSEIGPMFRGAPGNVYLPVEFVGIVNDEVG